MQVWEGGAGITDIPLIFVNFCRICIVIEHEKSFTSLYFKVCSALKWQAPNEVRAQTTCWRVICHLLARCTFFWGSIWGSSLTVGGRKVMKGLFVRKTDVSVCYSLLLINFKFFILSKTDVCWWWQGGVIRRANLANGNRAACKQSVHSCYVLEPRRKVWRPRKVVLGRPSAWMRFND